MKKINYIVAGMLTITLLGASCTKLDFYPHSAVAPESFTEKDLDAVRNGMYNAVQNKPGRESYIMFDLVSGNLIPASGGTVVANIRNVLRTENSLVSASWDGYYKAMYQVNNVIDIVTALPESPKKEQVLGEAYFFRAYLHYNLVTRWGDVPLMLHNTDEPVARTSQAEVWAAVEKDMTQAIQKCGGLGSDLKGNYTYLSKEAAKAFMARVLIGQNKKEAAATYAEEVVTTGLFSLDDFQNIFRVHKSKEEIFTFSNVTEESAITLSRLFYTYGHSVGGSYVYKPTDEVMELFESTDNRKELSVATVTSLNVINKYPSGQTGTDPFPVIRLAEMYLILAEAKGLTKGLEYLNTLRKARGVAVLSPTNEIEYQDLVALERRREFVGEGYRYFDLVRTGKLVEELDVEAKYIKFPIPDYEREVNKLLTQNDGY